MTWVSDMFMVPPLGVGAVLGTVVGLVSAVGTAAADDVDLSGFTAGESSLLQAGAISRIATRDIPIKKRIQFLYIGCICQDPPLLRI
jgi:hypothetical protein